MFIVGVTGLLAKFRKGKAIGLVSVVFWMVTDKQVPSVNP